MAVTTKGSVVGSQNTTVQDTIATGSHTVTSDTDLLLLFTGVGYNDSAISSITEWVTTTEPFVFIDKTTPAANEDVTFYVYGIVNPTAQSKDITVTFATSGNNHCQWAYLMNFGGTDTSSVANAVTLLEEVNNGTASTTTVFPSEGSAGDGLILFAATVGDNNNVTSNDASYTELVENHTGGNDGGLTDMSFYSAFLSDNAPQGPTVTWTNSRINAGFHFQLNAGDPNTIAVVDSQIIQQNGTVSYTAASGANRLLVIALHGEDDNADFSPQYGGVSFTDASTDSVQGDGGTDAYVGYILEADIPAGANDVTAAAYAGGSWTTNSWAGAIYTLINCKQGGQPDPAADEVNQSGSATSHTTGSVTSVTDGILIATFAVATNTGHDTGATITGYTHLDDTSEGGGSWITGYKLIETGASETATFDWNANNQTGASILVGFAPYSAVVNTTITVPTGPER